MTSHNNTLIVDLSMRSAESPHQSILAWQLFRPLPMMMKKSGNGEGADAILFGNNTHSSPLSLSSRKMIMTTHSLTHSQKRERTTHSE